MKLRNRMDKATIAFMTAVLIISVVKLWLCTGVPIYVIDTFIYDDTWCMQGAMSVRLGEWMGTYNRATLSKGSFFSFFLATLNTLGISYIFALNLLYILACIVFICVVRKLISSKVMLGCIYFALVFNPATVCVDGGQRVYRNTITQFEIVLIIACLFGMFLHRNGSVKKMLLYALGGGLAMTTFRLTREDTIWTAPYIGMAIIITVFCILKESSDIKYKMKRIVISIMPLIMLFAGMQMTRLINYSQYGVAYVNDSEDGNFPAVIAAMHSVAAEDDYTRVSISKNDLKTLYDISPTLSSIRTELDVSLKNWDGNDGSPGDGEIEDGWFLWAFREAVEAAGYYETPKMADEFYGQIVEEINMALDKGVVQKRSGVLPSAWLSPWREGYATELLCTLERAVDYTLNFTNMGTSLTASPSEESFTVAIEQLTGDHAVHQENEIGTTFMLTKVKILNYMTKFYQHIKWLVYIAVVLYVVMILYYLYGWMKKRANCNLGNTILLLTGMLGSYITLCLGISYTTISSFNAIGTIYLLGCYPLIIAFTSIAIFASIHTFVWGNMVKNRS